MASDSKLTVIFDGACGFCTRTVRLLKARDHRGRIAWTPCQQYPAGDPVTTHCMESIITITSDGMRDTGALAAARILEGITGWAWPVRIASWPVVGTVLSLGYRIIARLRSHLPGDVPWCERHPEDCQPDDRRRDLRDNGS